MREFSNRKCARRFRRGRLSIFFAIATVLGIVMASSSTRRQQTPTSCWRNNILLRSELLSKHERLKIAKDKVKDTIVSTPGGGQRKASVSKIYAYVNELRPPEYSNYENHEIPWNETKADYQIEKVLGRGKFSEVFLGTHTKTGDRVVIKCLKPVQHSKLQREHKVLSTLQKGPNIVTLRECVKDGVSLPAFVFDYVNTSDWKQLFPTLKDIDVRHYMFQLLIALRFCHKNGIIHRDVKPHNMVINHETKELRLIDFGLAEFYHPGTEYNSRVASRHYKGPELLAAIRDYDYSLDIWSFGCVLASLVFQKVPFFAGADNYDQMKKIAKVLGTEEMYNYLDKYQTKLDPRIQSIMGTYPVRPWSRYIFEGNKEKANDLAIDLIDKCLRYDHKKRLTVTEALAHPYFDPVRNGHPDAPSITTKKNGEANGGGGGGKDDADIDMEAADEDDLDEQMNREEEKEEAVEEEVQQPSLEITQSSAPEK